MTRILLPMVPWAVLAAAYLPGAIRDWRGLKPARDVFEGNHR